MFDRGPAIRLTLDSVFSQTRPPDEVVVVDDGSRDGAPDIVRREYPAVTLLTQANGGAAAARNTGASAASGDFLLFLDADDLLHPHATQILKEMLQQLPEAAAAFCDHRYDNRATGESFERHHGRLPPFDRLLRTPHKLVAGGTRLYGKPLYYTLLHGNVLQQPWMVRAAAFASVGGFAAHVRHNHDWELYTRLVHRFPVAVSDRVISTHVVEAGRDHLHLSAGQFRSQMAAIRHLIADAGPDVGARWTLRRRLAGYHKTLGDREWESCRWESWRSYLRAFGCAPVDHVVAARLLTRLPGALRDLLHRSADG